MKNRKETLPTMHRFHLVDHSGNVRILSINEEKRSMVLASRELRTFSLSYATSDAEGFTSAIRTCDPAMFETMVRRYCKLAKEVTRLGDTLSPQAQALADAIALVQAARARLDDATFSGQGGRYVGDFQHYVNELGSALYSDRGESGMLALLETMKKKGA